MTRIEQVRAMVEREPKLDGAVGTADRLRRLCRATVRALPAAGAGVSVMGADGVRGVAAISDPDDIWLAELQFTLGEGPCLDAHRWGRPVLVPDLKAGAMRRWPGYAPAAFEKGVRAVFAFPMQIGAARLGVLDVYREQTGSLSKPAFSQAVAFADVALTTLLDGQEDAAPGETASGLDGALESRSVLYQAQGMVSVQLGMGLAHAMARIRAYVYANQRSLTDVARDIVSRKIRLEDDRS
jgi:GAF domain-containing protein